MASVLCTIYTMYTRVVQRALCTADSFAQFYIEYSREKRTEFKGSSAIAAAAVIERSENRAAQIQSLLGEFTDWKEVEYGIT